VRVTSEPACERRAGDTLTTIGSSRTRNSTEEELAGAPLPRKVRCSASNRKICRCGKKHAPGKEPSPGKEREEVGPKEASPGT